MPATASTACRRRSCRKTVLTTAQRHPAPYGHASGKLATLIYRLLRWGQPYVDEGAEAYESRYRQQRIQTLAAKAKELGYQLTTVTA
jgi:hypothetical protein